MAHVRNAIVADGLFLAPKMRNEDKDELLAADGVQPMAALLEPFKHRGARNYSVIGTEEEYVVGMFGSVPSSEKGWGVAWLLCSDELFNYKKEFVKQCPQWVEDMGKGYDYLYNYVDKRNDKSLKWLKYLGFKEIEEIKEYGHLKMPFLLMVKEMK